MSNHNDTNRNNTSRISSISPKPYILICVICCAVSFAGLLLSYYVLRNMTINHYKELGEMTCNVAADSVSMDYAQELTTKADQYDPDVDLSAYATAMDNIVNDDDYIDAAHTMHSIWKSNRSCLLLYCVAFREDGKILLFTSSFDGIKDYPSYKAFLEGPYYNDDLHGIERFKWMDDDGFSDIKSDILESNNALSFMYTVPPEQTIDVYDVMTVMYPCFVSDEGYQIYMIADLYVSDINAMLWKNCFIILIPILIILLLIIGSCFIIYKRQSYREKFFLRKSAKSKSIQSRIQKEKNQIRNMAIALAKNTFRVVYVDFEGHHMYKVDTDNDSLVFNANISVPEYSQYFIKKYVLPQYHDRLNELYNIDYLIDCCKNGIQNIEYEYETHMVNDSGIIRMKLHIAMITDENNVPVSATLSYIEL